jgi:2',3'-cyclic-nucleotide 2'-phosphodiesterase (5'-nucleotidase family)
VGNARASIARRGWLLAAAAGLVACGRHKLPATSGAGESPSGANGGRLTISLVGSNDLHGRVESLPPFAGYLANLRRARARDGGAVLLLDAGDMFQGTLASNLGEGAAVVRAYNALGYTAAALGNHEFDFGPVGPAVTARPGSGDDPRGALRARATEAAFPFLDANLIDATTGAPPAWRNVRPTTLVELAGIEIGIVGVTTASTPRTTLAANFAGLAVKPLAATIAAATADLHRQGATVVIVAAHAGGVCHRFDQPEHFESCEADGEIFQVARELAAHGGAVDAIVAGHTHEGVAHRVAGIPIVEAFANGHDFSRIDLTIDRASGRALDAHIFPPHRICAPERCAEESYEGAPVVADPAVAAAIAPALEAARAQREEKLGPVLAAPIKRAQKTESPLGNLFADLMRAARPGADVALTNGGSLRTDLPAGPLTYGQLFEALPFDNRFATVSVGAGELAEMIARNLGRDNGILSVSGLRAEARCAGGDLAVKLTRTDGRPISPGTRLTLVTSDFLATGGDGLLSDELQRRTALDGGPPIRDAMADLLRHGRALPRADDRALYDPARPRLTYPGPRPVRCSSRGLNSPL